jgi:hypothetical protein
MCLPSTSHIHCGNRDTWTRPDGTATSCIDYVVIPRAWREYCTRSEVISDFDLATTRCDHQAVGLELSWWQTCAITTQPKPTPAVAWHLKDTQQAVRHAMHRIQVPEWKTDVETQENDFSTQVADILQSQQRRAVKPKKCYINEEIWEKRRQMIAHQKRLKQVRQRIGREAIWLVFNAWKTRKPSPLSFEHFQYGTSLRCDAFLLLAQYRTHRWQIRHMLKKAKVKLMEQCLEQVTEHTEASSILHILRGFMGSTNPKKQKKRTLPMLMKDDGTTCRTPDEALQVWIQFFADMEGGQRQSLDELHTDWVEAMRADRTEPFRTKTDVLPTLADLELAYRRVASGKATGPDRVPGELCHHAPVACARATYSSLWKLLLFGQSTRVACLYKRTKGKDPPPNAAHTALY